MTKPHCGNRIAYKIKLVQQLKMIKSDIYIFVFVLPLWCRMRNACLGLFDNIEQSISACISGKFLYLGFMQSLHYKVAYCPYIWIDIVTHSGYQTEYKFSLSYLRQFLPYSDLFSFCKDKRPERLRFNIGWHNEGLHANGASSLTEDPQTACKSEITSYRQNVCSDWINKTCDARSGINHFVCLLPLCKLAVTIQTILLKPFSWIKVF